MKAGLFPLDGQIPGGGKIFFKTFLFGKNFRFQKSHENKEGRASCISLAHTYLLLSDVDWDQGRSQDLSGNRIPAKSLGKDSRSACIGGFEV